MDRIKLGTVRVDNDGRVVVVREDKAAPGVEEMTGELVHNISSTDPENEKDSLEKWRDKGKNY